MTDTTALFNLGVNRKDTLKYGKFLPRDAMNSAVLLRQVVCLSVRQSVTLRYADQIGWKSSEIISHRLASVGCSLFAAPTSWVYSKGNTPKFWPE